MKYKLFVTALPFLFLLKVKHAQVFKGKITDKETSEPLPYANIGVVGKNVGGISYDDGSFSIDISLKPI